MKPDRFQTVIPESGTIKIPHDILKNFAGHLAQIMIQEVSKQERPSKIRALRGKYHQILSSTKEFCHRKANEKALEL